MKVAGCTPSPQHLNGHTTQYTRNNHFILPGGRRLSITKDKGQEREGEGERMLSAASRSALLSLKESAIIKHIIRNPPFDDCTLLFPPFVNCYSESF